MSFCTKWSAQFDKSSVDTNEYLCSKSLPQLVMFVLDRVPTDGDAFFLGRCIGDITLRDFDSHQAGYNCEKQQRETMLVGSSARQQLI